MSIVEAFRKMSDCEILLTIAALALDLCSGVIPRLALSPFFLTSFLSVIINSEISGAGDVRSPEFFVSEKGTVREIALMVPE